MIEAIAERETICSGCRFQACPRRRFWCHFCTKCLQIHFRCGHCRPCSGGYSKEARLQSQGTWAMSCLDTNPSQIGDLLGTWVAHASLPLQSHGSPPSVPEHTNHIHIACIKGTIGGSVIFSAIKCRGGCSSDGYNQSHPKSILHPP